MPGQTSRSDKLHHSLWVLISLNQFHPLWSSLLTWYDDSKANRFEVSQCMNEKIRWNMNMVFSFFVSQINKNNIGKLSPQSKKRLFLSALNTHEKVWADTFQVQTIRTRLPVSSFLQLSILTFRPKFFRHYILGEVSPIPGANCSPKLYRKFEICFSTEL